MCLKKCNFCFEEKDELEFYTYHKSQCKQCIRDKVRFRSKNNPEKKKEQDKRYYLENKDNIKANVRDWKKNNPDKVQASRDRTITQTRKRNKRYYERIKPEFLEKCKKYRLNNKDKINAHRNARLKVDKQFHLRTTLAHRIHKVLKGINKSASTIELLGCSIEELKIYLEKQFKEGMNWENYGLRGWIVDHITPCASFSLIDPEEQKKCFHYSNLQPLWWKENLIKGDKLPDGTQGRNLRIYKLNRAT